MDCILAVGVEGDVAGLLSVYLGIFPTACKLPRKHVKQQPENQEVSDA